MASLASEPSQARYLDIEGVTRACRSPIAPHGIIRTMRLDEALLNRRSPDTAISAI